MILELGQFEYRLGELVEAYQLDKSLANKVVAIEFEQVPVVHKHMAYSARLTKDGKGDELPESPRFIRKRTVVKLLDKSGEELWTNTREEPESV